MHLLLDSLEGLIISPVARLCPHSFRNDGRWCALIDSRRSLMQWKRVVSVIVSLMFTLAVPKLGISQSEDGQSQSAILVPASSIELPGDVGHRAHTNHLIKFD